MKASASFSMQKVYHSWPKFESLTYNSPKISIRTCPMAETSKDAKPLFLYNAAWHFAPHAMRIAAIQERSKPVPKMRVKRFDNVDEKVATAFEHLGDIVGQAIRSLSNPQEPSLEMKANLIAGLASEKFQAFGLMIKPRVGVKPQKIPAFIFEGRPKIDWAKNSVENLAHRFEGIKIQRNLGTRLKSELSSTKAAKGRPSVGPDIFDSLKAAFKADKTFLTLGRKNQCKEIRRRLISIAGRRYDATYPADRTIKKAIYSGIVSLRREPPCWVRLSAV
jgi:hypothetical protein